MYLGSKSTTNQCCKGGMEVEGAAAWLTCSVSVLSIWWAAVRLIVSNPFCFLLFSFFISLTLFKRGAGVRWLSSGEVRRQRVLIEFETWPEWAQKLKRLQQPARWLTNRLAWRQLQTNKIHEFFYVPPSIRLTSYPSRCSRCHGIMEMSQRFAPKWNDWRFNLSPDQHFIMKSQQQGWLSVRQRPHTGYMEWHYEMKIFKYDKWRCSTFFQTNQALWSHWR